MSTWMVKRRRIKLRNIILNAVCITLALIGAWWTADYFWKYFNYEKDTLGLLCYNPFGNFAFDASDIFKGKDIHIPCRFTFYRNLSHLCYRTCKIRYIPVLVFLRSDSYFGSDTNRRYRIYDLGNFSYYPY